MLDLKTPWQLPFPLPLFAQQKKHVPYEINGMGDYMVRNGKEKSYKMHIRTFLIKEGGMVKDHRLIYITFFHPIITNFWFLIWKVGRR